MLETIPSSQSVDLQLITYQEEIAMAMNRQLIPFHFNFDTSRQQGGREQRERIKDQSFVSDISLNGMTTNKLSG